MTENSKRLQLRSGNSQSGSLVLEMVPSEDRFTTELFWLPPDSAGSNENQTNSGERTLLARSVEGASNGADPNWPRSSPLQEVVPQTNDEGDYLAGVGQCGKSHWSVIIRPLPDRLGFDFDFACRVKSAPIWLGSTYQLFHPTAPKTIADQRLVVNSISTSAETSESGLAVIQPVKHSSEAFPATIQWRYQWVLENKTGQTDQSKA